MKIGLVRRGYSPTGGAEAYLRRFAEGAAEAGHTPVLFAAEWPRADWPFDYIAVPGGQSPRAFAEALDQPAVRGQCDFLFSLERIARCDAYRAGDGVHAAWLERRARFEPAWKPWLRRFNGKHREMLALERQLYSPAGAGLVVANSHLVKKEILAHFDYPAERIHVVYNGVPPFTAPPDARARLRQELGYAEDDYLPLFAGSGWERKGLRFAIEALNKATDLPRTTLLVAGRGNSRGLPASDRVRYLGPVKDMPSLLAAADTFILPTLYEPFSNACLEALAAGLPVITTTANGFAEIIQPGVEGHIVSAPDDLGGLSAAIQYWSDPTRRTAIRPQLQTLGTRFSIGENVRQTLAIIESARSSPLTEKFEK